MRVSLLPLILLAAMPASAQTVPGGATNQRVPVPLGTPAAQPPQGQPPQGQPPQGMPATMVFSTEATLIATCDADGDGVVTRAELGPCIARGFARVAGSAPSFGYIGYSDWALRYLGDANALPSPFTVDANADNQITAAELTGYFDAAFVRLDTNHDGRLTRAELITIRSGASDFGPPGRRGRR